MTKTTPGAMRATPGPWKVFSRRGIVAIMKGKKEVIHWSGFDASDFPNEAEANARLIAASPEMLEALQALMDEYKRRMDGDYPGENLHQFQSAYKMARAAISAATGEGEKP